MKYGDRVKVTVEGTIQCTTDDWFTVENPGPCRWQKFSSTDPNVSVEVLRGPPPKWRMGHSIAHLGSLYVRGSDFYWFGLKGSSNDDVVNDWWNAGNAEIIGVPKDES